MTLFKFGKKKEEQQPCCNCGCPSPETGNIVNSGCSEAPGRMDNMKVLGAGCKSCHEQYENAQAAVKTMGLSMEVEYITDMEKLVNYGVISMPAIVVNGKVVSKGKVLKATDVEKLLHKLGY